MTATDALTLAVREHAAWCDLVCRLHRFSPEGDGRLWWSARRSPDGVPDAVTLVPDVSVLDVLGRISDSSGASVEDSFATLDLTDESAVRQYAATATPVPDVAPRCGAPDAEQLGQVSYQGRAVMLTRDPSTGDLSLYAVDDCSLVTTITG